MPQIQGKWGRLTFDPDFRDVSRLTFDPDSGEVSRLTFDPDLVEVEQRLAVAAAVRGAKGTAPLESCTRLWLQGGKHTAIIG